MSKIDEARLFFQKLKIENLTQNETNKVLIESFESSKQNNTLADYLKKHAWNDDIEGETRIYLVKDNDNQVLLYFSIKCGLLFSKNKYDNLDSHERDFIDMYIDAKKENDIEALESYYEYGSNEFGPNKIDKLINIANEQFEYINESNYVIDNSIKVKECFSGIEIQHICKNEAYEKNNSSIIPIGFGVFWEQIVPMIAKINKQIGCKYVYLFAADNTNDSDVKKLVDHYKNAFGFQENNSGIFLIKPQYDNYCYGMIQEIKKLDEAKERIWKEFSDVN